METSSEEDSSKLIERMKMYKNDIIIIRELRDEEELADKQLQKSILNTWKTIKTLREQQGCQNTGVKLQIHTAPPEGSGDDADDEIEAEIQEYIDVMNDDYNEKMVTYQLEMEKWKKDRKEKVTQSNIHSK